MSTIWTTWCTFTCVARLTVCPLAEIKSASVKFFGWQVNLFNVDLLFFTERKLTANTDLLLETSLYLVE